MRSWVIGSRADCDVVVDSPLASGRHCQLTQNSDGLVLEDLGSTNGTYVDGNRIAAATRVTPAQQITIGQTMAMPWPSELTKFIRIGRIEGNDIVLDDPRVSSKHARLMIVGGTDALIEDLGSSNGTFLNSAENRVTRLTPLSKSDTVYFGSLAVPAARLLAGLLEVVAPVPAPVRHSPITAKEPSPQPVGSKPAVAFLGRPWLVVAFAQVPLLAILIAVIGGRHATDVTPDNWRLVGQGIAATTFALSITAVWLGCSVAVAAVAGGMWPLGREEVDSDQFLIAALSRLGVLASVSALGCVLLLAIVYWGTGLKGPWLTMAGVLVMDSLVGLLFGLLISSVARSWQAMAGVLIGCFALMTALGGWLWPPAGNGLPASIATGVTPNRWAFDSLLLLESPQHPSPETADAPDSTPDRDLAEDYFRARSERMGPQADAMALGSMLLGLAAAVALTLTKPR
jgi:pSer/pThr/pTyr-binding forkhead associated (FHA) protein